MNCLRCSHEWIHRTADAPKTCPRCKTPEWNTPAPPALKCAKCSYEWRPRTGTVPEKCPGCKTKKWNGAPAPTPSPSPETQTQLDRFNSIDLPDEPHTAKCPKCSHEWQSRTDAPKKCPKCQARLDADVKTSAQRAARALAAVGPITANLGSDNGAVCDLPGRILGWVKPSLVFRGALDAEDRAVHYPVFSGPTFDGEYQLCGWISQAIPFERRS